MVKALGLSQVERSTLYVPSSNFGLTQVMFTWPHDRNQSKCKTDFLKLFPSVISFFRCLLHAHLLICTCTDNSLVGTANV